MFIITLQLSLQYETVRNEVCPSSSSVLVDLTTLTHLHELIASETIEWPLKSKKSEEERFFSGGLLCVFHESLFLSVYSAAGPR